MDDSTRHSDSGGSEHPTISNKAVLKENMNDTIHHTHANRSEDYFAANQTAMKDKIWLVSNEDNIYAIENNSTGQGSEKTMILVLVHSSTENFEQREAIRRTWGSIKRFNTCNITIVFILGLPTKPSVQSKIKQESDRFKDIIQGKFNDTYHNLTIKAVLGLRWATEHCKGLKFIVKVDDDVYLNSFQVYDDLIRNYFNVTRTIICKVRPNGTSKINRKGKWKVDMTEFVNLKYWPVTYCPGHFVVYTADIISELYAVAKMTPFLWLDDVYVTGLLADRAGNISHRDVGIHYKHLILVKSTRQMYQLWKTQKKHNV